MNDKDSNIAGNEPADLADESKMGRKYADTVLFPADKLLSKLGHNLAKAEALDEDRPLRTEKTVKLENMGQGEK